MSSQWGPALAAQPTEGKSPMPSIDAPIAGTSLSGLSGTIRVIDFRAMFNKLVAWIRQSHPETRIAARYAENCWDDAIERKLTDELMDFRFGRR